MLTSPGFFFKEANLYYFQIQEIPRIASRMIYKIAVYIPRMCLPCFKKKKKDPLKSMVNPQLPSGNRFLKALWVKRKCAGFQHFLLFPHSVSFLLSDKPNHLYHI